VKIPFSVSKDELAWRVRDFDMKCLCPWGRKGSPAQSNLPQERLASSLVIRNVAGINTRSVGKSKPAILNISEVV
jgi:hypothetical protein